MKKVIVSVTVSDRRTTSGLHSMDYPCTCESDLRKVHRNIKRWHETNRLKIIAFTCDKNFYNNYNYESWLDALDTLIVYINNPNCVTYRKSGEKKTEVKEMRNMRLKVTTSEESVMHMVRRFHAARRKRNAIEMAEHTKRILELLYMTCQYTISYDSIDINRLGMTFEITLVNQDIYEIYDLECKMRDTDEWDDALNRKLCDLAGHGLLEKYENADSETFENVLMEAAYHLGICI